MTNMGDKRPWQYDEFKQVGKDYSKATEVAVYDASHADFRDIEEESNAVLEELRLKKTDVLIDFGAGTGTFAVQAALRCAEVHAVDVSEAMIGCAKAKTAEAGVSNIQFHHCGFLTYHHQGEPVDAITTTLVLHHLPDFWKGIALTRLNRMLKPGGQLYLHDVVIAAQDALENIADFIDGQATAGGDFLREDAEDHFREEYSTYDWIMEGLLLRAGFTLKRQRMEGGVFGRYRCVKTAQSAGP